MSARALLATIMVISVPIAVNGAELATGWALATGFALPPLDFCMKQVASSDIYLGVFGFRYGHVDTVSGRSITESVPSRQIFASNSLDVLRLSPDKAP